MTDKEAELLGLGLGVTNIASRPTHAASELSRKELVAGAVELEALRRDAAPSPRRAADSLRHHLTESAGFRLSPGRSSPAASKSK